MIYPLMVHTLTLKTASRFCHTLTNSTFSNLDKSVTKSYPEPLQSALLNTEVSKNVFQTMMFGNNKMECLFGDQSYLPKHEYWKVDILGTGLVRLIHNILICKCFNVGG